MLEMIVEKQVIYVLTGGFVILGIVSKCISNATLKRLVRAAGNMSKSNHALMRLVRAKFEHACMVSEKVENVGVFVDKFLYEYKVLGMKLHSWRRMEILSALFCLMLGALGAFLEYTVNGMNDAVIRVGAYGGILGILLYLFHLTSDENYRLKAARNYMVDYLENVCLHRYEKLNQKETTVQEFGVVNEELHMELEQQEGRVEPGNAVEEPIRPHPGREVPSPRTSPEIKPPTMPEPYEVPKAPTPVKAAEKEKKPDKDVLIRQILEEFMA